MKKNLLFLFLLMILIIPTKVKGETFYFNYGEYQYSNDVIEERKDLEVQTIIENGNTIYKYRTRDYLIIPSKIIIDNKDFNILSLFDTNLPIEDIKLRPKYDLDTMNNCYGKLIIEYKDTSISKSVYIEIDNYINIPKEIMVNDYEGFNIWNYIDTNIMDKDSIEIIGEYNLGINGTYDLLIKYSNLEVTTKIIVDIDNNDIIEDIEDNSKDDSDENNNLEEEITKEDKEKINFCIIDNTKIYETIKYINVCPINEEESDDKEEKESNVEKEIVPINNKISCECNNNDKKYFYYISYSFYSVVIILLSIIVVRKK